MKNEQEIIEIVRKQHMFFNSSVTHAYDFRINELKKLKSGIGSYHGFNGFERFSHKKSILKAASWLDLPLIYLPYKG